MRLLAPDQLTGRLVKAARALAAMSASDLATASGLSVVTIKRAEAVDGLLALRLSTAESIIEAFAAQGVQFIATGQSGSDAGVVLTSARAKGGAGRTMTS
ncbi:MAG: transcriptional regulator [Pseudomonadota bacterium]